MDWIRTIDMRCPWGKLTSAKPGRRSPTTLDRWREGDISPHFQSEALSRTVNVGEGDRYCKPRRLIVLIAGAKQAPTRQERRLNT